MTLRRRIFSFAFAISMLTMPVTLMAQGRHNVQEERDSTRLFRGIAVSYDLAGTVMRMVSDYGQYEAALRVNLRDRYFPIVEVGLGDANHKTDLVTNVACKVSAPYGRIGLDLNMAKNKHDDYRIYVGARYGFTSFVTEVGGIAKDPYWDNVTDFTYDMRRCNFHWFELAFTVDGKLWGPVRLGWSVRYRKDIHKTDLGADNLWYVPGYGKYGNKIGATFNVTFEI